MPKSTQDLGSVREEILKEFEERFMNEAYLPRQVPFRNYTKFLEQALAKVAEQAALEAKKEVIEEIGQFFQEYIGFVESFKEGSSIPKASYLAHLYYKKRKMLDQLAKEEEK